MHSGNGERGSRRLEVRTISPHERGAVLDLLGEWFGDRGFFQRYFEHEPSYRDDLCFVAVDGDWIVSTLQVFTKVIHVDGVPLRVAGVGNVFTTESHRQSGAASALLERAIAAMESGGFDLSLLFAVRLSFYGRFGWASHRRLMGGVSIPAELAPPSSPVRPFDLERDLDAVMEIYEAYRRARNGVVARDRGYWESQMRYAGNPGETFLVAERDGRVVAYGRLTNLYDIETVMEHGAADGARRELVDVLLALAARARPADFFVVHLGADPELRAELTDAGLAVNDVEDVFWMWRVISAERLAAKLGLDVEAVGADDFFERILPYEGSVYWSSDRF